MQAALRDRLPIALGGVGLLLISRGAELTRDSASYLDAAVYRTPLYPLFLDLLQAIAAGKALIAAVVLQAALGLSAISILVRYLRRALGLPTWVTWLTAALLLLPYVGPLAVANRIQSEALAYPLFLLAMRYLLAAIVEDRAAPLLAAAGLAGAAVLARPQLLFLYPVVALVALGWSLRRRSRRRGLGVLGALALVMAVAGVW